MATLDRSVVPTPSQRREFRERGFLRIEQAFSPDAAAEMERVVWKSLGSRFGVSPTDPATWNFPPGLGLQGLKKHTAFGPIGSTATLGALGDLLGDACWERPAHWGQFLVSFPTQENGEWTVPHRVWHTDFPLHMSAEPLSAALVFSFLSEVPPGHGTTMIVAGSHRVVRRFLEARPRMATVKMKVARRALLQSEPWLKGLSSDRDEGDRVARFMETESKIGDIPVRVVELTGHPGDIVVCNPAMLHAGSLNCAGRPRFMRVQRIRAHT